MRGCYFVGAAASLAERLARGWSGYIPRVTEKEHGEELVQADPEVLQGEDELPRQPAPPLDPYTPEPGPRAGERRAFRTMRIALIAVAVVVAVVVYAALR